MAIFYKEQIDLSSNTVSSIFRSDGWWIPLDPSNSDYQRMKIDLAANVELQNSNGVIQTSSQVQAFLATLK